MTSPIDKRVAQARGRHEGEDEAQFKTPSDNPLVEPDRVSPAVEGYFRMPAVWVGEAPHQGTAEILNPAVHHATVLEKRLSCGVEVRVQRDGLFLFDFSAWELAPVTLIPGYVKPEGNVHYSTPNDHQEAERKAEEIAVFRAQVMNAHQACLTTAEALVMRRAATMGFPVHAWNTHKSLTLGLSPAYRDDIEDVHALARNVLNNSYCVARSQPLSRRVLETPVVEKSLELLDNILSRSDRIGVELVEAAYISACRSVEKRFGESIVIGWSVCEQLIWLAWKRMLDEVAGAPGETVRMPKGRRKKLNGRDYSASVMVEVLEIKGAISHDLYRFMERARKARNNWAHEMKVPSGQDVHACHKTIQDLLHGVLGIPLHLQAGGRGAVPRWNV